MILRQLDILLYPPAISILLLLLAMLLWRHRKTAFALVLFSMVTLLAFSMPITSHQLALILEKHPAIPPAQLSSMNADAIVLLGGGMVPHADEYDASSVTRNALKRLRYAAYVQRQTGLPLITTGGDLTNAGISEAETMKNILTTEFNIQQVQAETGSRTTYENAVNTARLLRQENMQRILLVTSSLHMNRSADLFSRQDLDVIPAPTDLYSDHPVDWRSYVPSGDGLGDTQHVLHEYLGIAWYWLRS